MYQTKYDLTGQTFGGYTVLGKDPSKLPKTEWICQCICGKVRNIRSSKLLLDPPSGCIDCFNKNQIEDIVGQVFGDYTVIKYVKSNKFRQTEWLCKCKCGFEKILWRQHLTQNLVEKCKACRNRDKWSGHELVPPSTFNAIAAKAQERNIIFDVGIDYLSDLLLEQDLKCALTGLDIYLADTKLMHKSHQTASLDRIDSLIGYLLDNVQWIHKDINWMKWDLQQEIFIEYCRLVTSPDVLTENEQLNSCDFDQAKYYNIKSGAKSRNLEFDISLGDIKSLFFKQKGKCALTGIPIFIQKGYPKKEIYTGSLDRIDPDDGYVYGNIWWVHKKINLIKRDFNLEKFKNYCRLVTEYNYEKV